MLLLKKEKYIYIRQAKLRCFLLRGYKTEFSYIKNVLLPARSTKSRTGVVKPFSREKSRKGLPKSSNFPPLENSSERISTSFYPPKNFAIHFRSGNTLFRKTAGVVLVVAPPPPHGNVKTLRSFDFGDGNLWKLSSASAQFARCALILFHPTVRGESCLQYDYLCVCSICLLYECVVFWEQVTRYKVNINFISKVSLLYECIRWIMHISQNFLIACFSNGKRL